MTEDRLIAQMANFDRCVQERDSQLAETVLHSDYALIPTNPTLQVVSRSVWLGMLPDYVVHSWRVEEHILDASGDCAASLQRVDMHATVLGVDRSGLFILTDIWRRHEDEWLVWRRHSTAMSAGTLPGES